MIETAFDQKEELNKVVDILLKEKLVSSCQVITSNSAWNWQGQRENAEEYLLLMKTKQELAKEVYQKIKEHHSYETFEFAIFDLTSYSTEYLEWIKTETKN